MDPIDYLPANSALLDQTGFIVAINRHWVKFAQDNGWNDCAPGIGTNYLDICLSDNEDPYAVLAYTAILNVLSGRVEQDAYIYPCHSPDKERWFSCKISRWREGRFLMMHFLSRQCLSARELEVTRDPELCARVLTEYQRIDAEVRTGKIEIPQAAEPAVKGQSILSSRHGAGQGG